MACVMQKDIFQFLTISCFADQVTRSSVYYKLAFINDCHLIAYLLRFVHEVRCIKYRFTLLPVLLQKTENERPGLHIYSGGGFIQYQ